jgi:hypothetical protein
MIFRLDHNSHPASGEDSHVPPARQNAHQASDQFARLCSLQNLELQVLLDHLPNQIAEPLTHNGTIQRGVVPIGRSAVVGGSHHGDTMIGRSRRGPERPWPPTRSLHGAGSRPPHALQVKATAVAPIVRLDLLKNGNRGSVNLTNHAILTLGMFDIAFCSVGESRRRSAQASPR